MLGRTKRHLAVSLSADEQRLMITAMMSFRNKLIAAQKPTEDVNDLLLRLMK